MCGVDELVGRVRRRLGPDEMLMVISDHGFQSFRRGVNLNTWLQENGLLYLKEGVESGDWFDGIDWIAHQGLRVWVEWHLHQPARPLKRRVMSRRAKKPNNSSAG